MIWILSALLFLFLIILSYRKVARSKGLFEFIYHWGFPVGAFVWEDLLFISIYGFIGSLVAFTTGQNRIGLLFLAIFWIVRSSGETLYFFLQQFIQPKHHPHYIDEHFKLLRKVFGNISYQQCLVIMQVIHQIVVMIALVCFILLIIFWNHLS